MQKTYKPKTSWRSMLEGNAMFCAEVAMRIDKLYEQNMANIMVTALPQIGIPSDPCLICCFESRWLLHFVVVYNVHSNN